MQNSVNFLDEALENLGESHKFNKWMVSHFKDELKGNVLWEIGAGTGNISEFFTDYKKLYLTEFEEKFLNRLKKKFNTPHITTEHADLTTLDLDKYKKRNIDNIICINVLEHIKNDALALKNIAHVMHPTSTFALLVPSHPFLYGELDRKAGHYRRYTKSGLTNLLKESGFDVLKTIHFNKISALGWFLKGKFLKKPNIGKNDMKIIETLLPVLKLEKYFPFPFGQSLITINKLNKQHQINP